MSLTRLVELVPPPKDPTEVGTTEQWAEVEGKLGVRLPEDYRQFVFTYGTGLFAGFYIVLNPFSASEYIALVPSTNTICGIYRELQRTEGKGCVPYPIFPDPGGILPWGKDENGNFYFWRTEGPADKWKVVQDNVRGEGFKEYDCSMTAFLAGILDKRISPLAAGYPDTESYQFVSYKRNKS